MFDSSWNSVAFQRFCATVVIIRNGPTGSWILADADTGKVISNDTYQTREAAEMARRMLYDAQ
jgi:hypothetical protein